MTPPTRPTIVSAVLPRLMLFKIPLVTHPPTAPAIAPIRRTNKVSMVHSPLKAEELALWHGPCHRLAMGRSGAGSERSLLLVVMLRRSPDHNIPCFPCS